MHIVYIALLIIIGILLFEMIIFFHELGHFISAKKSGIKVNEFALGMGPKIFSFQRGETKYSLRILPIGGYCAMEGEDDESDSPRAFNSVKIWKRMIVIIAGAVMNIVLGLIFMAIILAPQAAFSSTTIEAFPERSYSANSGLQAGDKILKLNNYGIATSRDLSFAISTLKVKEVDGHELKIYKQDCTSTLTQRYAELAENKALTNDIRKQMATVLSEGASKINVTDSKETANSLLQDYNSKISTIANVKNVEKLVIEERDKRQRFTTDITVLRNGSKVNLANVDFYTYLSEATDDKEPEPAVSIDFYVVPINKNILTLTTETFKETISIVRMVWSSLAGMVTGQYSFKEVSGPIGVTTVISQVASEGLKTSPGWSGFFLAVQNIVFMMMVITVNLGVVNMMPFPALDGGRFVFLLIEAIFKKPIPRKYEAVVNGAGFVLLLSLMAVITLKDIWQLFTN